MEFDATGVAQSVELQKPPKAVMLDIDDTVDTVHGHQKLSVWNARYDERCFLPTHLYDKATGWPVVMTLRPGKTQSGVEERTLVATHGVARGASLQEHGATRYGLPCRIGPFTSDWFSNAQRRYGT